MPYPTRHPIRDDESPILGPTGRPLRIPYFDMPTWMVYLPIHDAKAVGFAAWLWTFVNSQTQDFAFEVTVSDVQKRWGLSRSAVTSQPRKRSKGGLVERLEAASILEIERRTAKTRDCDTCSTPQAYPCPTSCTETKGRVRAAPRYAMRPEPPLGFLHPHPIDVGEATYSDRIDVRLHEEGPHSRLEAIERRQSFPYITAMTWVAYHPQVTLIDLAVYVVLCSRISTSRGRWTTNMLRSTIGSTLGIEDSTVGESTARLERLGAIGKAGLNHRGSQRRGSGGATRYVVLEKPGAGLLHPLPLHVGEWRSPEQVTARIDAVLAHYPNPRRPAHKPSDLGIVDNSEYPQGGMCAQQRGHVRCAARACALCSDRTNNPTTNHTNNPPSVGGPQPQGGEPVPNGSGTDGDAGTRSGSGHDRRTPEVSSGVPDPIVEMVRLRVPAGLCRNGEQDQQKLAARLRSFVERGYLAEHQVPLVFDGVSHDKVNNPFAVVEYRTRSVPNLQRHLEVLADLDAKAAQKASGSSYGKCPRHWIDYDRRLSTPDDLVCLPCRAEEEERRREFEEQNRRAPEPSPPVDDAPLPSVEELDPEVAARIQESLKGRRTQAEVGQNPRVSAPQKPWGGSVGQMLDEVLPKPETPYCGSCQQEDRTVLIPDPTKPEQFRRILCGRCHPTMV